MPSAAEDLRAAAAETRRELGPHYDEAVLLSLAERLEHRRGRSTSMREAVAVVIALGSIGLGVLVAAATHPLEEGRRTALGDDRGLDLHRGHQCGPRSRLAARFS